MEVALPLDPDILTRRQHLSELLTWKLAVLFLAALLFRLMYNSFRELVPDESYYWVWSRHLSLSYFDHPPMVAYLIWASTKLLGSNEFGVRLPAALLSSGTVVLTTLLVRRLTRNDTATWLAAVVMVTSPIVCLTGTLMTPDTPLMFFFMLGLVLAVRLLESPPVSPMRQVGRWCVLGAVCGLAMLSKYTGVLLPATVAAAVITTRSAWPEMRRPGLYLSVLIAAAIASPIVIWNSQHDWASFRFQFQHGFGDDEVPGVLGFAGFIGAILLTWTPVFCFLFVVATVAAFRSYLRQDISARLVLLAAVLPLVLFGYSSFHKKVEGNWPAIAFAPAAVLIACWAANDLQARRRGMVRAIIVALLFTLLAHVPEVALVAHVRIPAAMEVFGWRKLAAQVDSARDRDESTVVCCNYQNASELSFYLQGQPDVWSINYLRRPNAYDYFAGKPDLTRIDHAIFVGGEKGLIRQYYPHNQESKFTSTYLGREIRVRTLSVASR
ncbi:hypothetical protein BH10PLA1_BH10PLA1_17660 [soil metagenome]